MSCSCVMFMMGSYLCTWTKSKPFNRVQWTNEPWEISIVTPFSATCTNSAMLTSSLTLSYFKLALSSVPLRMVWVWCTSESYMPQVFMSLRPQLKWHLLRGVSLTASGSTTHSLVSADPTIDLDQKAEKRSRVTLSQCCIYLLALSGTGYSYSCRTVCPLHWPNLLEAYSWH